MIRFLSLSLLCVAFVTLNFEANGQAARVSPKAGTAISSLDANIGNVNITGRAGLTIGADWRNEKGLIYLQPGLFFQNYNLRLTDNQNLDNTATSRITAVKAPLNVGWYFNGRYRLWIVHVRAGVVPTYVLGSKSVDQFNYSKDLLNDFQVNANLGLGVDLAIFTVDFSYEWGLTDVIQDVDSKANLAVITLGLIF